MGQLLKLFILCLFLSACSSNDEIPEGYVEANITGIDARLCVCCGGVMITLSENSEQYEEPYYQWYNNSDEFEISINSSFPIPVYIQFKDLKDQCSSSLGIIDVLSIIRI